jgi:hypothetical protein
VPRAQHYPSAMGLASDLPSQLQWTNSSATHEEGSRTRRHSLSRNSQGCLPGRRPGRALRRYAGHLPRLPDSAHECQQVYNDAALMWTTSCRLLRRLSHLPTITTDWTVADQIPLASLMRSWLARWREKRDIDDCQPSVLHSWAIVVRSDHLCTKPRLLCASGDDDRGRPFDQMSLKYVDNTFSPCRSQSHLSSPGE